MDNINNDIISAFRADNRINRYPEQQTNCHVKSGSGALTGRLSIRAGFSLVEVLITIMVVSLLFAAMVPALVSSKDKTSSAPWRYVVGGTLAGNGAVYTAGSDNSVAVIGSNHIPYDKNAIAPANLFETQNPKLLITTAQDVENTDREGVQKHLIGFYQNRSDGQYDYIGKISFDKDYNLAMGQFALENLKFSNNKRAADLDWNDSQAYSKWPLYDTVTGTSLTKPYGMFNTAIGQYAMSGNIERNGTAASNNNTGYQNTAVGAFALKNNTTGYRNSALGYTALGSNTTGYANIAAGNQALAANTTGYRNVAIGEQALLSATTGTGSVAIGSGAQKYQNAVGAVSVGYMALRGSTSVANNTGGENTAIGFMTLYSNTSGQYNTALGYRALFANSTGESNTAGGDEVLYSNTTGSNNTGFGESSLYSNTTGSDNSALGLQALTYNTTGSNNTAVGSQALINNETGNGLTAVGYHALYSTETQNGGTAVGAHAMEYKTSGIASSTAVGYNALKGNAENPINNTGRWNDAFGMYALENNTTGECNSAFGQGTLRNNTTGTKNVVMGDSSMRANTTGSENVAVGFHALYENTDSTKNVAVGSETLNSNTTGEGNTAVGWNALKTNTTGGYNNAFGANALLNTTGRSNVAIGTGALKANTTGGENIGIGNSALVNKTTGGWNTVIGFHAGYGMTSGSNNVIIGSYTGMDETELNDRLCIDSRTDGNVHNCDIALIHGNFKDRDLTLNASGKIAIGTTGDGNTYTTVRGKTVYIGSNNFTTSIQIGAAKPSSSRTIEIGNSSSTTVKINGKTLFSGSSPVYYSSDERLKENISDSKAGLKEIDKIEVKNFIFKKDEEKQPRVGVIAQALQKVFPNSVYKDKDGYLAVNRDEIFFAMVNAIKELHQMLVNFKERIALKILEVEEQVNILDKKVNSRIDKLEAENKELRAQNEKLIKQNEMILKKLNAKEAK